MRGFSLFVSALVLLSCPAFASPQAPATLQPLPQGRRVAARPELTQPRLLTGHVPAWARPESRSSQRVAAETRLTLTVTLARAPAVQAAFEELLAEQQRPRSPLFHHWLTPAEVGELYGPLPEDVDALRSWLNAQGLRVDDVSPSRMFVQVSAPAATVERALRMQFAMYPLDGVLRRAAAVEPSLPEALLPLVAGIHGLNDVPERSSAHVSPEIGHFAPSTATAHGVAPRVNSSTGQNVIAPDDFEILYHLRELSGEGVTGTSQHLAVIGLSRMNATDLLQLAENYGISSTTAREIVPPAGSDPGLTADGDELETTIDAERARSTAQGVNLDLVVNSRSAGGLMTGAQYAVQNGPYQVMSLSYGLCEASSTAASIAAWDALFAQAAAQGISTFAAAGDFGAEGCYRGPTTPLVLQQTPSINLLCASSYVTCVGGTEFTGDLVNAAPFWSASDRNDYSSVIGYIPEGAWNEPTTTSATGGTVYEPGAGGGGASQFIAKPAWQTGTGVPADGARDTPDVSFSAALHDGYLICYAAQGGDCAQGRFLIIYGTSAGTPSMAGIAARFDQVQGSAQGNLNPLLYRIAQNPAFAAFHDVTVTSSGVTSCATTVPSPCNNSAPGASGLSGGLAGYAVTPGYDLATGLGSLDVANFFAAVVAPAPVRLYLSGRSVAGAGTDFVLSAVAYSDRYPPPTGPVSFLLDGAPIGTAPLVTSVGMYSNSSADGHTSALTLGSHTLTAVYAGDPFYAGQMSDPEVITVIVPPGLTISPAAPSITVAAGAASGNTEALTLASVNALTGTVSLACAVTGVPAGSVAPVCTLDDSFPFLTVGGSTTVHATLSTTARVASLEHGGPGLPHPRVPLGILVCVLLPLAFRGRKGRPYTTLLVAVLAVTLPLVLTGCGGGGSSGGSASTPLPSTPPAPAPSGTAAGTYTVTVSGMTDGQIGPVTAQASFSLVVQ